MSKYSGDPGYQAFRLLQIVFIVAPIVVGLDKFSSLLADWSSYLSPFVVKVVGTHQKLFLSLVGVIEVIVGVGVMFKPRFFANIVAIWFAVIIINLLTIGHFFDIAIRDFGLMLSAIALSKLSRKYAEE